MVVTELHILPNSTNSRDNLPYDNFDKGLKNLNVATVK